MAASNPGRPGARRAQRSLGRHGSTLVARNCRPPPGATDLASGLARDTLVLVDVKTRTKTEFGAADRAVDAEKTAVVAAARDYTPPRWWSAGPFDLVSIVLGKPLAIEWIRDAFPAVRHR